MKYLLTIVSILTLSGAASADSFTIEITNQRILGILPVLCPVLRASLPSDQRDPWGTDICVKKFVIHGMNNLHFREESRTADRVARQRKDVARRALIIDSGIPVFPTPEPTPEPVR